MPQAWEDNLENKRKEVALVPSEVVFNAWVELECTDDVARRVRCSFNWLNAEGDLNDFVDAGCLEAWDSIAPLPSAQTVDAGTVNAPQTPTEAGCGEAEENTQHLMPRIRRFERASPAIQATCAFIRRIVTSKLKVQLSWPDPAAVAQVSVQTPAKTKNKAAYASSMGVSDLTFEVALDMLLLLQQKPFRSVEKTSLDVVSRCPGVLKLRVGMFCQGPIMSDSIAEYLNPMVVTLDAAHQLPQDFKACRDVYGVLHAFNERVEATAKDVTTRAGFDAHAVFFVGTWRRRELRDFLQTGKLHVEVHDRGAPPSISAESVESHTVSATARSERHPVRLDGPPSAPYGVASFILSDLVGPYSGRPRDLKSNLQPQLAVTKRGGGCGIALKADTICGPDARELLASMGSLAWERTPPYLECGSYVTLKVWIARPILWPPSPVELPSEEAVATSNKKDAPAKKVAAGKQVAQEQPTVYEVDPVPEEDPTRYEKFARFVLITDVRQTTIMKRLLAFVTAVNIKALMLDEAQARTIASVQLTPEQRLDKTLDILTGFCVIDRRTRITVVEGLRDGAVVEALKVLQVGEKRHSSQFKLLHHSDIGFSERLYSDFNLCIKQIKLRDRRLEKLAQRPILYERSRGGHDVVETVTSLMNMKRAPRLHTLKLAGSFPTALDIATLETQYGDYVADEELQGGYVGGCASEPSGAVSSRLSTRKSSVGSKRGQEKSCASAGDTEEEVDIDSNAEAEKPDETYSRSRRLTLKPGLEMDNVAFRKALDARLSIVGTDIISRNIAELHKISCTNSLTRPRRVPVDTSFLSEVQEVHIYSQQKLNSAELQKKAMRIKMSSMDDTFSYSPDFNSGCFPMVDDDVAAAPLRADRQQALREGSEVWRYPKARDAEEFRKPERNISSTRAEELATPWVENEFHPELGAKKIIKGAFDMKTLGAAGSHVIQLRRPGLQPLEGSGQEDSSPPPAENLLLLPPMRYPHGYASMGLQCGLDKQNGLLEGDPKSLGLRFENRKVPKHIARKFGNSAHLARRNEPSPVSMFALEPYLELPPSTSEHLDPHTRMLSRAVAVPPQGSVFSSRSGESSGASLLPQSSLLLQYRPAPSIASAPGNKQGKRPPPVSARGPPRSLKPQTTLDVMSPMSAR